MVLKLYGNPMSTCTRRVLTVLKETSTPYELVVIDLAKQEQKAADFIEKQPFGQVPYIVSLPYS
jgi:glutathione S-transferase